MADQDAYKQYNEQIKTFESLAKRESELLQKIGQADPERDIAVKIKWANELHALLETTKKLQDGRATLIAQLAPSPRPADGTPSDQ